MGILNLTEDSFFDGGKYNRTDRALAHVEKMLNQGAFFIDVGVASSKPGSAILSSEEEKIKLLPTLEKLITNFPDSFFSIDTYKSHTAKAALEIGASMINDISGGILDPEMFTKIAPFRLPYIIMHMEGKPENMQHHPQYEDITKEVKHFLIHQTIAAEAAGIKDVLIDPGFGFGKTLEHNFKLLKELNTLTDLNCPMLIGLSRKSMIYKYLNFTPKEALNGTTALHAWGLERGASILRVHDVKEAKECVDLWRALH